MNIKITKEMAKAYLLTLMVDVTRVNIKMTKEMAKALLLVLMENATRGIGQEE